MSNIVGYQIKTKSGNYPECFRANEVFLSYEQCEYWISKYGNNCEIIPIKQGAIKDPIFV